MIDDQPLCAMNGKETEAEADQDRKRLKNPEKYVVFSIYAPAVGKYFSCVIPKQAAKIIFENDLSGS